MKRRTFVKFAAASALLPALGRVAWAQDAVEASRSENRLLIYSGMSMEIWDPILKIYAERYPWIAVEHLELSSSEITERYLAEAGSGARTADLIAHVPDGWMTLAERGTVQPVTLAGMEPYATPVPGLYTFAADPVVMVWNKLLLRDAPRGIADLAARVAADPSTWTNRVTTYSANTGSFGYSIFRTFAEHHGDAAWRMFDALGPLTRPERGSGAMLEKVVSGEYLMTYFCGSNSAWQAVADAGRASILDWSFVADGTVLMQRGAAVMQAAQNPNAARLMVELMLSREGQIAMCAGGLTPFRDDIAAADVGGRWTRSAIVAEVGAGNVLPVEYDPALLTGYAAFIERWKAAYQVS